MKPFEVTGNTWIESDNKAPGCNTKKAAVQNPATWCRRFFFGIKHQPWGKASGSPAWWRRTTSFPPDVAVPGTLSRLLPVGPLIIWGRRPWVYNEIKTNIKQLTGTNEIWLKRNWVRNCEQVKTKQKNDRRSCHLKRTAGSACDTGAAAAPNQL